MAWGYLTPTNKASTLAIKQGRLSSMYMFSARVTKRDVAPNALEDTASTVTIKGLVEFQSILK
eukprot:2510674-Amphidinium_carterae.2